MADGPTQRHSPAVSVIGSRRSTPVVTFWRRRRQPPVVAHAHPPASTAVQPGLPPDRTPGRGAAARPAATPPSCGPPPRPARSRPPRTEPGAQIADEVHLLRFPFRRPRLVLRPHLGQHLPLQV